MAISNSELGAEIAVSSPAEAEDDRLIELWLHGRSPATIEGYGRDIVELRRFLGKPISQCSLGDLQAWANELHTNLQPSSVRRKLAAAKSVLKFGHQVGLLRVDVGSALRLPKTRDTLADRILTEDEVWTMIRLERNERNRLILEMLYLSGIRVSEICRLQWRDLRRVRGDGQLNVFGKGGKTRQVLLPGELVARLFAFRGSAKPSAPMFRSQRDGHLSTDRVWLVVKTAAERAGLDSSVSPHFLRHTHATEAIHAGCPIDVLQRDLGHSSLSSTERYLHAQPRVGSATFLLRDDTT